MRRIKIPGIGTFDYPDGTPDEFIYADVDRRIMEGVGFPSTTVPQTTPDDEQMPALEQAAVTETPQLTTTLTPQVKTPEAPEAPERASFVDVFKESFDDIFEAKKALKYGFTGDESAADALLKAGQIDKEMVGGVENIKSGSDFVQWAKETIAGTAGFLAAPTAAAFATGAVTGGVGAPIAFFSTVFTQFLVDNLADQAAADRERADRGEQKKGPSILKATGAATFQTALTRVGAVFYKPLAKLLGAFGTKTAEETAKGVVRQGLGAKTANAISKGVTKADNALAKFNTPSGREAALKTLGKGAAAGAGFEIVQEVAQTVLQRAQSGRPLTGDEANKAYLNSIAGALLIGTPMGSLNRSINKYQNKKQEAEKKVLEQIQKRKAEVETAEEPVRKIQALDNVNNILERVAAPIESLKLSNVSPVTEQEVDIVLQDAGITPEDINNLNFEDTFTGKVELLRSRVKPQLEEEIKNIDTSKITPETTTEREVADVDTETTGAGMAVPTEPRPGESEGLTGAAEGPDTGGVDAAVRGAIDPTKRETKVDAPITPVDLKPAKFIKFANLKTFNNEVNKLAKAEGKKVVDYKKENNLPKNSREFFDARSQEVETFFEDGPIKDKVRELIRDKKTKSIKIDSVDNKKITYTLGKNKKTARVEPLVPLETEINEEVKTDIINRANPIINQPITQDNIEEVGSQARDALQYINQRVPELNIRDIDSMNAGRAVRELAAVEQSIREGRRVTPKLDRREIQEQAAANAFEEEATKYDDIEQSLDEAFGNSYNSQSESKLDKFLDILVNLKPTNISRGMRSIWRGLVPPEQLAKAIARRDYGSVELNTKISQAFTQYRDAVKRYHDLTAMYLNEARALGDKLSAYMHANRKNKKSKDLSKAMYASSYFNVDASLELSDMQTAVERKAYAKVRPMYDALDEMGKELYRDMGNFSRNNYERYVRSVENTIDELAESATQRRELQEEIKQMYLDKRLNYYVSFSRMGNYWIFFEKNGELVKASVDNENKAKRVVDKLRQQEGVTIRGAGYLEKNDEIIKDVSALPSMKGFKKIIALIDSNSKKKSQLEQKLREDLKEQLTTFFIKNLPQNSAYLGALARNKDLGFSVEPVDRVFSSQAFMQARQIATLDGVPAVEDAIQNLGREVDTIQDQNLRSQLLGAKDRFTGSLQKNVNPDLGGWNTGANVAGSLGFYYYLTSFATPIINLINTPTMSASMIMGKYGATETYNELMNTAIEILGDNASKGLTNPRKTTTFTYAQLYGRTNDPSLDNRKFVIPLPTTLTKSEERALARAYVENVIESNQIVTQSGVGIDINRREINSRFRTLEGIKRNNIVGTASTILFGTFQGTETLNKEVTFLAAYRLANKNPKPLKTGEKFKDAYSYGKEMARESHGDYSYANSGEYFKNPALRTALMFKKFPVLMYTNWFNSIDKAFRSLENKGYSKEEIQAIRKEGRRQLLGMLTTGLAAAGIYSVPLGFALVYLLNLLVPDDEEENPFILDPKNNIEEYLSSADGLKMPVLDVGPKDIARILFTGVPETVGDFEIANRAGVGAGFVKFPYQEIDDLEYWLQLLGGPMGSLGVTAFQALGDLTSGNLDRGVKALLPGSVRQMAKAAMIENEGGLTTRKGLSIKSDLDSSEKFLLFLGFTPKSISRLYGVKTAEREVLQNLAQQKGDILDDFSKVVLKKTSLLSKIAIALHLDSEPSMKEVLKEITEFNKDAIKAGVLPIDGSTLQSSLLTKLTINFKNDTFGLAGESTRSNLELFFKAQRMQQRRESGFID